ncbi:hypothetical protein [Rubripirellula reticaptiva]|uniref:DUF2339 domain-containing protein n=1 Tax=Rubripirellula reticaptiva TaxID=2528013 RepID=A0A5C6EIP9_9BACT|nr:hypothetical protein [Rubripirellula reticaptiva]TWU47139.1 hypothetical protein Poly59_61140 [Rubripirellula reticaptiva]
MNNDFQLRSFARFLYTQNPFYLISCFLILYGLQIAAVAHSDLFSRSIMLSGGIVAYTLLMAVTCVAVVRLCKVWDDARSIFLIVAISFVAFSIGLDELCVVHWNSAAVIMVAGAALTVVVTESLLRLCRLKFPSWFRLSFYLLLAVFFATPLVLGRAVAEGEAGLTNWGAMLFSIAIAAALLVLIPAVRRGAELVQDNGSPWSWPLYPISLFVIVVVLAAIRSHAIWMSFGFIGAPVQFEPLLLLPIGFAILVLLLEVDAHKKSPTCAELAMFSAPLMLLGSWSPGRTSHLPFLSDLRDAFGSTGTFCMVLVALFYGYACLRRVPLANRAAIAALMMISGFGTVPPAAEAVGVRSWMFALLASAIVLIMCLKTWRSDQLWIAFAGITTVTIAMAFRAYGEREAGRVVSGGFAIASMMTIGAVFDGELAEFLRFISGIAGVIATGGVVTWHFWSAGAGGQAPVAMIVLGVAVFVSLAYSVLVRRTGWWYVAGFQAACLAGLLGTAAYRSGSFRGANLPIQSGLACFVVGVTITSLKTGVHHRLGRLDGEEEGPPLFLSGF